MTDLYDLQFNDCLPKEGQPILCQFGPQEIEWVRYANGYHTRGGVLLTNYRGYPVQPDRWWSIATSTDV